MYCWEKWIWLVLNKQKVKMSVMCMPSNVIFSRWTSYNGWSMAVINLTLKGRKLIKQLERFEQTRWHFKKRKAKCTQETWLCDRWKRLSRIVQWYKIITPCWNFITVYKLSCLHQTKDSLFTSSYILLGFYFIEDFENISKL